MICAFCGTEFPKVWQRQKKRHRPTCSMSCAAHLRERHRFEAYAATPPKGAPDDTTWHPYGYWVSPSTGNVYARRDGRPITATDSSGYINVHFRGPGGANLNEKAHRLVYEVVHGEITDPALEINHVNGDKKDNRIVNLELVTSSENQRHAFAIGLQLPLRGTAHPRAKLSEDQAAEIYLLRDSERSANSVARDYGVTAGAVLHIWRDKTWTHVTMAL